MEKIARIIISFVLLGISLAGILLLVWPKYQEFSLLRAQLEVRQERIEKGEEALAGLRAVEAKVQERQEDFAKIEEAIPRDIAPPALYDHVQKLATSSGLQLQSLSGTESEGELSLLAVQAELEGSYEGFKQFLNAAQRSPRLLNVRSLDIASSPNDAGAFRLTIQLVAYARP